MTAVTNTSDRSSHRQPDFHAFLAPDSVAIVGASETEGGYPAKVLMNLREFGFAGSILPVNPRRETVFGLPCYPSLAATPTVADLALIMVPASGVEAVVAEAAAVGVRAAVIFSSGFAELGSDGVAAQRRIEEIAARSGLLLLGPNSQGYFHQPTPVVASFSTVLEHGLTDGARVAYVGQSGALGGAVLGFARARGIGIASWFSTGNEAGVSATQTACALLGEPDIGSVVLHLESVPDGPAWLALADAVVSSGKTVVCIRSGRSGAGQRAAASHTGAMTRGDAAFTLVAERAGIALVDDIDVALDVIENHTAPAPSGRRVGIVTTSGGAGGLAADHLERYGIEVPVLSETTQEQLAGLVPAFGAVANPVDVTAQLFTGDQANFGRVAAVLAADRAVDAVLVVVTNLSGATAAAVARGVAAETAASRVPCQVVWLAPGERVLEARETLEAAGIRFHSSMAAAARALDHRLRPHPSGATLPAVVPDAALIREVAAVVAGRSVLTEYDGGQLLSTIGIKTPASVLIVDEASARRAAALEGRLVVKVQSPQILHKTEVGGVRLDVTPDRVAQVAEEVRAAAQAAVPDARIEGVLVQPMASPGVDLIVGVRSAGDGYPPVVTVGAGGIATELFRDVVSALAPLSADEALELVRRLRSWPLLDGFRGAARVDLHSLAAAVSRLSHVAVADPLLREIEINPLRVDANGATALDLLVLRDADDASPTND